MLGSVCVCVGCELFPSPFGACQDRHENVPLAPKHRCLGLPPLDLVLYMLISYCYPPRTVSAGARPSRNGEAAFRAPNGAGGRVWLDRRVEARTRVGAWY